MDVKNEDNLREKSGIGSMSICQDSLLCPPLLDNIKRTDIQERQEEQPRKTILVEEDIANNLPSLEFPDFDNNPEDSLLLGPNVNNRDNGLGDPLYYGNNNLDLDQIQAAINECEFYTKENLSHVVFSLSLSFDVTLFVEKHERKDSTLIEIVFFESIAGVILWSIHLFKE